MAKCSLVVANGGLVSTTYSMLCLDGWCSRDYLLRCHGYCQATFAAASHSRCRGSHGGGAMVFQHCTMDLRLRRGSMALHVSLVW